MSEQLLYNLFRKYVITPNDRIDRIENVRVNGMPDTNLCIAGVESWIELKCPQEPVRRTTPLFGSNHRVSQDQKNWFLRQQKAGGRCYFLIMTDKRCMLLNGSIADIINEMRVNELTNSALWVRPRPLHIGHWQELRSIL